MKNKAGFVPKSSPIQPDYYQNIFGGYCAVFITKNDEEYHLQMNETASSIEILKPTATGRHYVTCTEFKTIKSAIAQLEKTMNKNNQIK